MGKEMDKGISRRKFLFGSGIAAAGIATVGLAACEEKKEEPKPPKEEGPKWDKEYDVVVCGTGPAGLSCAAAAAEGGAGSVLMIDSAKWIGGKGIQAGGNFGVGGGTRMQKEQNMPETRDDIYNDRTLNELRDDGQMMAFQTIDYRDIEMPQWRRVSGCEDAEGMAAAFADESLNTWNWIDKMGAKFIRANLSRYANVYRGSRWYTTTTASPVDRPNWKEGDWVAGGAGIYWYIYDTAINNGAECMLQTKMTKIIRENGDRDGRVIGIEAELLDEGNKVIRIKANKAVFLGTGSWKGNPTLKQLFYPWLSRIPHISGEPLTFNDGNGVEEAMRIGAAMTTDRGNDWHGWHRHPGTVWHSVSPPFGARGTAEINDARCMYVNSDGKRYMDEEVGEHAPCWFPGSHPFHFHRIEADLKADADGPISWIILDDDTRKAQNIDFAPGKDAAYGVICIENMYGKGDTIEALAAAIGVPANNLVAAVKRYNELVDKHEDTDFHKHHLDAKIATPPFHGVKWGHQKHNTLGGVTINAKGQVQDWKLKVIPGLYAAGESAGGMDLIGLARPTVFGRIAGMTIAKEEK